MIFVAILLTTVIIASVDGEESCKAEHACKLEELGCFDDKFQRALPEEILNERDVTSQVFSGITIDWKHFSKWLAAFACRCAKKASAKGYTVIGLQFYGECWSGPDGEKTYDKYGKSNKCIDGNFRSFSNVSNSGCIQYVGRSWTNHVYRIATPGCARHQIEPIGCFHDDLVVPRPMPNYLMNERDYHHKGWNGHLINWAHWKTYSPEMICRCADAAKKNGHPYFAIQYYGECWTSAAGTGRSAVATYSRNGASSNCVNEFFKPCKCNSYNCVGKAYTNYVYKLLADVKCSQ